MEGKLIVILVQIALFSGCVELTPAIQSKNDIKNSLHKGSHHLKAEQKLGLSSSKGSTLQPCTCGVFLSGQFTKGSSEPPKGYPALVHEQDKPFACSPVGAKQCQNKCLEAIVRHLPNSQAIICGTIDRDCHKERAYLFIQNCNNTWQNTNLSAGKEYCCKDGAPYQCPLL